MGPRADLDVSGDEKISSDWDFNYHLSSQLPGPYTGYAIPAPISTVTTSKEKYLCQHYLSNSSAVV
jgi:hypothetical protein